VGIYIDTDSKTLKGQPYDAAALLVCFNFCPSGILAALYKNMVIGDGQAFAASKPKYRSKKQAGAR